MKTSSTQNNKNASLQEELKGFSTLNLISYYLSGKAVSTPLSFLELEGKIYARTRSNAYKLKRIAKTPKIRVFASNQRGIALGPELEAQARILIPEEEADLIAKVMAAFKIRNPILHRLTEFFDKRRGYSRRIIEIT